MKKAYENWHQVIEYDGKAFSNSKKTRKTRSSQNEVSMDVVTFPNAVDNQLTLPRLPIAVSNEQPLLDSNVPTPGIFTLVC